MVNIDPDTIQRTRGAMGAMRWGDRTPLPYRVVAHLTGYSVRQVKRYAADGGPAKFRAALIGAAYVVRVAGRGPDPVNIADLLPDPDSPAVAALTEWYQELRADDS